MTRLARLLLFLAVPARRHRACLLGDLEELYALRRRRDGRVRAGWWYWSEVWSAAARYTVDRLTPTAASRSQAGSRPPRPPNRRATNMETLRQDVGYALRTLRKAPGFTAVAAVTIALGIGATTTIFSVADAVLFRAPPGVRAPDRLVTAHRVAADGSSFHAFSYPNFVDYRNGANGLARLAAFSTTPVSLTRAGDPELAMGLLVSPGYFEVVGARPGLGRFFFADEDGVARPSHVAVLSHRMWMRRFDGDSSVVNRSITINRQPFTIVGVAEEGFLGHAALVDVGVFLPVGALQTGQDISARSQVSLELVGRLRDGVTVAQAQQAMSLIAARLAQDHPESNRNQGIEVRPYTPMFAAAAGPAGAFMGLLFAAAGVILVIASINVGGMLLSRASTRGKEMALRLAVGAPRRRLVRQLVTESVVLFLLGGGVGIALTLYATGLLNAAQLPIPLPLLLDFAPDLRALGFSLAVAFVTGIVFGLAPALHVTKPDLNTTLKEDAAAGQRSRLRSAFVVAQVAGSALLLVAAGLFLRGLARADAIDLGMDPREVHVAMVDLDVHNYTDEEAEAFFADLGERVAALPGVVSQAMIDMLPLSLGNQTTAFTIEGREPVLGVGRHNTDFATITPEYFATMRVPLLRGRPFTASDDRGAPGVVVVNEAVARRVWPDEDPIGKHMQLGSFTSGRDVAVVGVVRTAKYRTVGEDDRNMVYVPYAQAPRREMALVVRLDGTVDRFSGMVRSAISELDSALPLQFNTGYRELMGIALLPNQAATTLATLFGALGLLLAAVGLYGVLAFSVAQRTREIGIRLALGARESQVRSMVLRHGVRLAAVGLGIGFTVAVAVTRFLRGMLFGVSPTDPVAFVGIGVLLLSVALGASYLPALRATRTNPVETLRE